MRPICERAILYLTPEMEVIKIENMPRKKTPTQKFMKKIGAKGGAAIFKKLGSNGMSKLAKRRWVKK